MTTPDERLEQLRQRALATDVEPVLEPEDLARLSVRALLEDSGGIAPPDRSEIALRLHGLGVPNQHIPVRDAAAILASVQEVIASIGQALRYEPTLHGVIQAQILKATELQMSPEISAGSVVFHLIGPGESITGNEATQLTGTDTLVDAAVSQLFVILERSEAMGVDSSALAQDLRRLGPRTAKHLSDLVKRTVGDQIDLDFTWRNPRGQRRRASLQRGSAIALRRAIDLNKLETRAIELTGVLVTVSAVRKAELRTDSGSRITMAADSTLAATLGPFFNQRVVAQVEQTTAWSMNTGKETRSFRLLGLRMVELQEDPSSSSEHLGGLMAGDPGEAPS